MTLERSIRLLAGLLVLASLSLAAVASTRWLLLAVFVGLNLVQSSFTGFCPAEAVLGRLFFGGKRSGERG
ncbi:MAG: DUF2892 domain-containing protein [Candidatus Krumholzibacteriota bacterium]|nr:DUF2892 domain-containing protein [Candidatus Krumholzibacteriota bacterium]